ncbi:MAG: valine--tRNA ligase [Armatimonadota bacterium]|nr:valine--tRNA ligase [Armatimonadota bacterium]MDR5703459.1 valine--tRNA ligase [Armatimonadota bacterium]
MVTKTLSPVYDPKQVEGKWYQFWLERGYFRATVDETRRPYAIMMPLPNVTGSLHMGHALNNTLQDLLTRFRRMQGFNALWQPGTDHAGIATQNVVERELAKEGLTREMLGREKFLERVWQWKAKYGDLIYTQLKRLGCSCDWDRATFTLDPGYYDAVLEAFIRLYEKGYIYRGKYMVNWCPRCLTSISDLEVEFQEVESTLYYVRYPGADGGEGIVIATQRPETIPADVAVAVHPEDDRYRHIIGTFVIVPVGGRRVPVIADRRVDRDFGSGALKITPGHDPLDYEIGQDHGLEILVTIDERGRLNDVAGKYAGMDRFQAREVIARDLQAGGFIVRAEPYRTSVGHCDRCHTVIEPYLSEQWFCRMKELAEPAIRVVKEGKVRFIPERWTKVYLDWMENIRDWCISRQLWWGHRIPIWYCPCGETIASKTEPEGCPRCGSRELRQEEDVLDTWFSSALWPFATLGWPRETPDLRYFYPTNVLITGRDIIFLWVARMIMMGLEFMGDVPFSHVYINPTVLNLEGKRMSKSLGTGLDPLDYIEIYGTDALRFALVLRCSQAQQDLRFGEKMIEDTRNFANKIWNAARFVHMNLDGFDPSIIDPARLSLSLPDRWILSRYARTVDAVTTALEGYEFNEAARVLYDFIWGEYCDWYVEMAKADLSTERRATVQYVLWYVLSNTMKLLHPIMPFLTEEVWQNLPHDGESIMVSSWPQRESERIDEQAEAEMSLLMDLIREVRSIRADTRVPPNAEVEVVVHAPASFHGMLIEGERYIALLTRAKQVTVGRPEGKKPQKAASAVVGPLEVFVPLGDVMDLEVALARLREDLREVELDLSTVEAKLSNPEFLEKAPAEVVEKERIRREELRARRSALESRLRSLQSN